MSDFLLVIGDSTATFLPQTDAAKEYFQKCGQGESWEVPTHQFTLPAQMAHLEIQSKLTIAIKDERGASDASSVEGKAGV